MGRPPTAPAVKELRGNPGKRKKKAAVAPTPAPLVPDPPDWMTGEVALAAWRKNYADLARMGSVATLDTDALARYCQAYSLWVEAQVEIRTRGMIIEVVSKHGSRLAQNPALRIADLQHRALKDLGDRLGLTSMSRAKLAGAMANVGQQLTLPGLDLPQQRPANDPDDEDKAFFGY